MVRVWLGTELAGPGQKHQSGARLFVKSMASKAQAMRVQLEPDSLHSSVIHYLANNTPTRSHAVPSVILKNNNNLIHQLNLTIVVKISKWHKLLTSASR